MTKKFKRAFSDQELDDGFAAEGKDRHGVLFLIHSELSEELRRCYALLDSALEVLEEVALPPYSDSDVTSLLETLRARAAKVLEKVRK